MQDGLKILHNNHHPSFEFAETSIVSRRVRLTDPRGEMATASAHRNQNPSNESKATQIQHSLGLLKGDPLRWKEVHDKQERYLRKHPSVRRSVKGPLDYVPANVEEGRGSVCMAAGDERYAYLQQRE